MLPGVDLGMTPGHNVWETALARTWWRMTGTQITQDERDALADLFTAATAEGGTGMGWRVMLSVIFRDPMVVSY